MYVNINKWMNFKLFCVYEFIWLYIIIEDLLYVMVNVEWDYVLCMRNCVDIELIFDDRLYCI